MAGEKIDAATQLRMMRILLNWRQVQMAEALSVSRESVCAWETAHRKMPKMAQRLLAILAERNGIIFNERGYPEYAEVQKEAGSH